MRVGVAAGLISDHIIMAAAAVKKFFLSLFRNSSSQEEQSRENCIYLEYFINDQVSVCHKLPEDAVIFKDSEADNIIDISQMTVTHLVVSESPNIIQVEPSLMPAATLTHLFIVRCSLLKLPSSIDILTNLKTLDVTSNKLKELPDSIGNLYHLEQLYIMSNSIKDLPISLIHLSSLTNIKTIGNPLRWPPKKICDEGFEAIKNFMTECLEVQSNRRNLLSGSKAYVTSPFLGSCRVPPLRSLVLEVLLAEGNKVAIEEQELPHIMKKQIAYATDFGRPSIPLSKCSFCLMFFTNDTQFRNHICKKKL